MAREKVYETVMCECGHECPVEFAKMVGEDANWICPNCYIEELTNKLKSEE